MQPHAQSLFLDRIPQESVSGCSLRANQQVWRPKPGRMGSSAPQYVLPVSYQPRCAVESHFHSLIRGFSTPRAAKRGVCLSCGNRGHCCNLHRRSARFSVFETSAEGYEMVAAAGAESPTPKRALQRGQCDVRKSPPKQNEVFSVGVTFL